MFASHDAKSQLPSHEHVAGFEPVRRAWDSSKLRRPDGDVYIVVICNRQGKPFAEAAMLGLEQLASFAAEMVALGYSPHKCSHGAIPQKVTFTKDFALSVLMRV